jgi:hypothetical protein
LKGNPMTQKGVAVRVSDVAAHLRRASNASPAAERRVAGRPKPPAAGLAGDRRASPATCWERALRSRAPPAKSQDDARESSQPGLSRYDLTDRLSPRTLSAEIFPGLLFLAPRPRSRATGPRLSRSLSRVSRRKTCDLGPLEPSRRASSVPDDRSSGIFLIWACSARASP